MGLGVLFEYLQIREETMAIFAVLLGIDFLLGVTHAYFKDKQSVTSTAAFSGLLRKVLRLTIPLSAAYVLKGLNFEEVNLLMSTIMGILIASEGYSIFRHYMYIAAKKELSEIDAIELALNKIIELIKPNFKNKDKNDV